MRDHPTRRWLADRSGDPGSARERRRLRCRDRTGRHDHGRRPRRGRYGDTRPSGISSRRSLRGEAVCDRGRSRRSGTWCTEDRARCRAVGSLGSRRVPERCATSSCGTTRLGRAFGRIWPPQNGRRNRTTRQPTPRCRDAEIDVGPCSAGGRSGLLPALPGAARAARLASPRHGGGTRRRNRRRVRNETGAQPRPHFVVADARGVPRRAWPMRG